MGLAALGAAAVGWHTRIVLLRLCARRHGAPREGPFPPERAARSQTRRSWEGSGDGPSSAQLESSARPFAVTLPPTPLPRDLPAAAAAVKPGLIPGTFGNINSWPSRLRSCASARRQASIPLHHPSPRGPETWEWGSGDRPGLGQTRCGALACALLPVPSSGGARPCWQQHWPAPGLRRRLPQLRLEIYACDTHLCIYSN